MQNSYSAQNLNQNSSRPRQNNAQASQNRSGGNSRVNFLRYHQQQEINNELLRQETIKLTTNTICDFEVYTCALILLGVLWLIGRSKNCGDDVSGMIRNTLIMYICCMVITIILHFLLTSLTITKFISFIAHIVVLALQIVWYIYCVDIFFRDNNNCKEVSFTLWLAHLIIVIISFSAFCVSFILSCCVCCLLVLVLFLPNEEMESKKNNAKMMNMLMGVTEFKLNSEEHLQEECIVCMDKYEPDSEIMRLPCNEQHYFHKDCILKWVERNPCCPLCKAQITSESLKKCRERSRQQCK